MTLALIAGQGGLPLRLVAGLQSRGVCPVICELEQFPSDIPASVSPVLPFRLETLGSLLTALKALGVTQICLAGSVGRPLFENGLIDARTAPLVERLHKAMGLGDDGALRLLLTLFEEQGFELVGAHELDPSLLPAAGLQGALSLPEGVEADVAAAQQALREMAVHDQGQAVVVKNGCVVAREEADGTDAMLAALAPAMPDSRVPDGPLEWVGTVLSRYMKSPRGSQGAPPESASGGILYKAPKPGQELRADMPVIGLTTAMRAAEAGLSGIVIAAGGVMVLDLPAVMQVLDAQGMFFWVHPS